MTKEKSIAYTRRLCVTALLMAMNVAMSSFGIPVPGGHLYLNDIVICTAAILLDPISAFFVGGVGAFLGDLLFYPTPMFVSLVTHGLQAVAISLLSHYILRKKPLLSAILGVSVGAVIMVVGYSLGRAFLYSTPAYALLKLPYQFLQAAVGAVFGVLLCFRFGIIRLAKKLGFCAGPDLPAKKTSADAADSAAQNAPDKKPGEH